MKPAVGKGKYRRTSINRRDGFNSEEDLSDNDASTLLQVPTQGFEADENSFKPLRTPPVILIQACLMITFEVLVFVEFSTDFFPIEEDSRFLFLSFLHACIFLMMYFTSKVIFYLHKKTRNQGYLQFDRLTKGPRRFPFNTLAFGLCAHLLLFTIWEGGRTYGGFTRVNILQLIFSIELLIVLSALVVLLIRTINFNINRPPPDSVEDLIPSFENSGGNIGRKAEMGFNQEEQLDEVIHKQGDMIRYLKHQKNALAERLLELTERLRDFEEREAKITAPGPVQASSSKLEERLKLEILEKDKRISKTEEEVFRLKEQIQKLTSEARQTV